MTNRPQSESGGRHSHMLITAYNRLLADVCELSGVSLDAPSEITYDWVLIEGPKLDKQVLMYLENNPGLVGGDEPPIPEWLMPLWRKFTISNDGIFLKYIRCLLLFCYKAEYEPSYEQLKTAQADFEDTDRTVGLWNTSPNGDVAQSPLLRTARQIIGRVIYRLDWKDIKPSHGPGSVFPAAKPGEKSRFLTYYPSIAEHYPYDQYLWCLPSFWEDIMVKGNKGKIQEKTEIVAKMTAVPKDSRGPRLICVHPQEAIWIQQGQRLMLEDAIRRSPQTRGKIEFKDQSVNSSMALANSASREFCTLDLSEASDRIGCELIRALFGEYAYSILSCSRATHIKLLDGRVIPLNKWAPMGNALCFPVESLVFYALVRAGIRSRYGIDCTDVYVFGDDILFPSKYYDGAIYGLVSAGMKPNVNKTFRKGFFRESCGVDAYNGKDVTPYRMKVHNVSLSQDAISALDLAKRLRQGGFEHCASHIYAEVRKVGWSLVLTNDADTQGFCEYVQDLRTVIMYEPSLRYRRGIQQWQVKVRQVRTVLSNRPNDDWYHLLDSLNRISHRDSEISDRGTEYPVPYRTRLTYGWATVHF